MNAQELNENPHLATESLCGLPRPEDDKYTAQMAQSNPLNAVWGRRAR